MTQTQVELSPLERFAEHLAARPKHWEPDEIREVADWLDYSLNRCGLVVIEEQRLAALPDPAADEEDALLKDALAVCEMVVRASMGETRPSRGESFIGWQNGDGADASSVRKAARAAIDKALATRPVEHGEEG